MKRTFDFLLAVIAIALIAPLLVVLILIIRFSDPGPIFFRQLRVGKDCQEFTIYKFRTMVVDAEKRGGHATTENDPRITRLGKFLRRSSLDELPQLLNVVFGDMSIVGPRPDVPAQKSDYSPNDWILRHTVRPGITGLAQATSRSSATAVERLRLDLEYVERPTLRNDLKIIFATIKQVLFKGGN